MRIKRALEGVGSVHRHDLQILSRLKNVFEKNQREFSEIIDSFPGYVRRVRVTRFLQYYELFRMTKDVPGDIVEAGIFRGFSFFALAHFLKIFCMGDRTKRIFGFHNFKGFEKLTQKNGGENEQELRIEGGYSAKDFREDFFELLGIFGWETEGIRWITLSS